MWEPSFMWVGRKQVGSAQGTEHKREITPDAWWKWQGRLQWRPLRGRRVWARNSTALTQRLDELVGKFWRLLGLPTALMEVSLLPSPWDWEIATPVFSLEGYISNEQFSGPWERPAASKIHVSKRQKMYNYKFPASVFSRIYFVLMSLLSF